MNTITADNYSPPSAAALPPTLPAEAPTQRGIPAGRDGLGSDGPGRLRCVSKTVNKYTGVRNEYALTYAWAPVTDYRAARWTVLSCECDGWRRFGACRHAVLADDVLNLPPVKGALLNTRPGQTRPVEINGAFAVLADNGAPCPCGMCGAPRLRIRLYTAPLGFTGLDACPQCHLVRVR